MKLSKDILAGLLFFVLGVFFVVEAGSYELGTALRMGPGYFPTIIGSLMTIVGASVIVRAAIAGSEPLPGISLRPLLLIVAAIVAFGALLDGAGFVAASIALVVISRIASPQSTLWGTAVLAAGLIVLSVIIFVELLNLPLDLWP